MNEKVIDPISGKEAYKYEYGTKIDADNNIRGSNVDDPWETPPKRKGHAWAPSFSATAYVTD
ncbi:hypothetical protein, partial [Xenorhabdus bovienii]|uniref:hypothetical protein n=1 Tax=Xenorhabdus bovienii TaxID=40576 RepID=UPI0023B300CD